MNLLKNRSAVVTGGGRGIGKAIALALAREGASLCLVSRTKSELAATEKDIRSCGAKVISWAADVSSEETAQTAVQKCREAYGGIDILVNSAGIIGPIGPLEEEESQDWRRTLDINLTGTFLFMKAALPSMKKRRSGKIINLSGGGASGAFPMHAAYAATKAATVRLTETVAEEVKEFNIQINAIAPGPVNTKMYDEMLKAGRRGGESEYKRLMDQEKSGGTPPERAAALAVFLASEVSGSLTGRLISAVWDDWGAWTPEDILRIQSGELYMLRRLTEKK